MKIIARLIVLLGTVSLSSSCMASDNTMAPPRLHAGDAWTYRITAEDSGATPKISTMQFNALEENADRMLFSVEIGDLKHIVRTPSDRKTYALSPVPVSPCLLDPIADVKAKELYQSSPCPYPLNAGMSWKWNNIFVGAPVTSTSSVVGVEEVSVPAGHFNAFKIEETVIYAEGEQTVKWGAPGSVAKRCNRWYSDQAKIVVKEVCDLYFGAPNPQHRNTFELAVYELH